MLVTSCEANTVYGSLPNYTSNTQIALLQDGRAFASAQAPAKQKLTHLFNQCAASSSYNKPNSSNEQRPLLLAKQSSSSAAAPASSPEASGIDLTSLLHVIPPNEYKTVSDEEQNAHCIEVLENPDLCKKLFTTFEAQISEKLKKRNPKGCKNNEKSVSTSASTTFAKSDDGCTAFTFLCSTLSEFVPDSATPMPLDFVIKWQNAEQCTVEKMGAKLFKALSFNSPQIVIPDSKIADKLFIAASDSCPVMATKPKNYAMIAMPQISGNTLKDAIKENKFNLLSEADIQKFMRILGELTALDITIGNNDRAVKFTNDIMQPFHHPASFNAGNLMVLISQEGKLVDIFPIDNCPPADLIDRRYDKIDEETDGLGDMFSESTDGNYEPPLPAAASSSSPSIATNPVEHVDPEVTFNNMIDGYHEVAKYLLTNLDILTNRVTENLVECIMLPKHNIGNVNAHVPALIIGAKDHFKNGLQAKLANIRSYDLDDFLKKLENSERTEAYAKRFIALLQLNFKLTQEL